MNQSRRTNIILQWKRFTNNAFITNHENKSVEKRITIAKMCQSRRTKITDHAPHVLLIKKDQKNKQINEVNKTSNSYNSSWCFFFYWQRDHTGKNIFTWIFPDFYLNQANKYYHRMQTKSIWNPPHIFHLKFSMKIIRSKYHMKITWIQCEVHVIFMWNFIHVTYSVRNLMFGQQRPIIILCRLHCRF